MEGKEKRKERLERYKVGKRYLIRRFTLRSLISVLIVTALILSGVYIYNYLKEIAPSDYDISLAVSENEKTILPGEVAVYNITVNNNADINDTVKLTLLPSSIQNWSMELSKDEVRLKAKSSTVVILRVTSSIYAKRGEKAVIEIKAQSRGDNRVSDAVSVTARVNFGTYKVELSISESERVIAPGSNKAVYIIHVKNSGEMNGTVEFALDYVQTGGWSVSLSKESIHLPPNESAQIVLEVKAKNASGGEEIQVNVTGSIGPPAGLSTDTVTTLTRVVSGNFGVELSVKDNRQYLQRNDSATYNITVKNIGDFYDTINITVEWVEPRITTSPVEGWFGRWGDNEKGVINNWTMTIELKPAESAELQFIIEAKNVTSHSTATCSINATSVGDSSKYSVLEIYAVAGYEPATHITAPPAQSGEPGKNLTFNFTVTNLLEKGNNVSLESEFSNDDVVKSWMIIGNQSIILAPLESVNVQINLTVRGGAEFNDYGVLTLTTLVNGMEDYSNSTFVYVNETKGVRLLCNDNVTEIWPGNTASFEVTIKNRHNNRDVIENFTLFYSSPLSAWSVNLSDEKVTLKGLESSLIYLNLTAPDNALENETVEMLLTAVLEGDESVTDSVQLKAIVKIPKPDLYFKSIWDVKPSPQSGPYPEGEPIWFNITVYNQGEKEAVNVTVHMIDTTFGDKIVGDDIISYIAPSGQGTALIKWIAKHAGKHDFVVVIDYYNAIDESDENNNEIFAVIPDVVKAEFDLYLGKEDIIFPEKIFSGRNNTITARVHNGGNAEAKNVTVQFVCAFNDFNYTIGNVSVNVPKGFRDAEVLWKPNSTGLYVIKVIIDPENEISETNETNNNASVSCNVLIPLPDLEISQEDITFNNSNPSGGEEITIFVIVHNFGNVAVDEITVRFIDVYNDSEMIIGDVIIDATIDVDGHGVASIKWTAVGIGNHTIKIEIDPENIIPELREDNNNATRGIDVLGGERGLRVHERQQGIISSFHADVRVARD